MTERKDVRLGRVSIPLRAFVPGTPRVLGGEIAPARHNFLSEGGPSRGDERVGGRSELKQGKAGVVRRVWSCRQTKCAKRTYCDEDVVLVADLSAAISDGLVVRVPETNSVQLVSKRPVRPKDEDGAGPLTELRDQTLQRKPFHPPWSRGRPCIDSRTSKTLRSQPC